MLIRVRPIKVSGNAGSITAEQPAFYASESN